MNGVSKAGSSEGRPLDTAESTATEPRRPGPYRRFRARIARYRALHITWRIAILSVGIAIICGGLAMLVLPGPGWAAIFVGLAVLSSEFLWAERLLAWSKRQARQAADRALDPQHRRRNQAVLAVVLAALALGTWWYVATYGWPAPAQWIIDLF